MNKLQTSVRKTVLLTVGKALTLCGVALTFAACYGTPPHDPIPPDYWAQKNAEESLLGVDQTKANTPEQTEWANRERCAETPGEQESQNEQSPR